MINLYFKVGHQRTTTLGSNTRTQGARAWWQVMINLVLWRWGDLESMPGVVVRGLAMLGIKTLIVIVVIESLWTVRDIKFLMALYTYGRLEISRSRSCGDTTGTLDKCSNSCRLWWNNAGCNLEKTLISIWMICKTYTYSCIKVVPAVHHHSGAPDPWLCFVCAAVSWAAHHTKFPFLLQVVLSPSWLQLQHSMILV